MKNNEDGLCVFEYSVASNDERHDVEVVNNIMKVWVNLKLVDTYYLACTCRLGNHYDPGRFRLGRIFCTRVDTLKNEDARITISIQYLDLVVTDK
mgnify:CR=1 FL=1